MKKLTFFVSKIRLERKLTTQELANISGVGRRSIERIEGKGDDISPSIRTLCKLADALEVPVTELFSYE